MASSPKRRSLSLSAWQRSSTPSSSPISGSPSCRSGSGDWTVLRKIAVIALVAAAMAPAADARRSQKKLVTEAEREIRASLVQTPADQEVCFSPDELCDVKLERFVESARESIDL